MVREQFGTHSELVALFLAIGPARDGGEAGHWAFARAPLLAVQAETVGFVIGAPLRHVHLHLPVTLEIHYRTFRRVDRQLMEVRGAEPGFLRVEIAEQTPLQERVVGEIDTGHDIRRAVGDLFGFRKEIIRVAIEHHASNDADREHFLRDEFGRIQHVVGQLVGELLIERLDAELPFRKVAAIDRFPKITPMEIVVGGLQLESFQWNFTKVTLSLALTIWKVWMPKPSIMRRLRGMARSDIAHINMWVDSGISDAQSQNVSCALPACGKARSDSILTAWMRSGNLMAS